MPLISSCLYSLQVAPRLGLLEHFKVFRPPTLLSSRLSGELSGILRHAGVAESIAHTEACCCLHITAAKSAKRRDCWVASVKSWILYCSARTSISSDFRVLINTYDLCVCHLQEGDLTLWPCPQKRSCCLSQVSQALKTQPRKVSSSSRWQLKLLSGAKKRRGADWECNSQH